MSTVGTPGEIVSFIWSVADLLRGDFKAHEFGQIILPFTVLRRLECALEPTKTQVVARAESLARLMESRRPTARFHEASESIARQRHPQVHSTHRSSRAAIRAS